MDKSHFFTRKRTAKSGGSGEVIFDIFPYIPVAKPVRQFGHAMQISNHYHYSLEIYYFYSIDSFSKLLKLIYLLSIQ